MPVRWPVEDNRFGAFNLPNNYDEISPDGQRKARMNAITLSERPEDVVRGWSFFRHWYLETGGFYKRRLPSPPIHYQWIHDSTSINRNIFAAPRGYAKSVVMGTEWPLFLSLSRPGIEVLAVTLEGGKAKKRGQRWAQQIVTNNRIIDDFGDLKGNHRKEGRLWSMGLLQMGNGSVLQTTSIGARNLGERPDVVIWDDIDPDPHIYKGNIDQVVEDSITALFDVFLPMLDGVGTAMSIIGTLLHRRSFLYWAMTTKDPRLKFFNRVLTSIYDRDGNPTWGEKFPKKIIKILEKKLGPASFAAAYLNDPRSGGDAVLKRSPMRTGYDLSGFDDSWTYDPFSSDVTVTHYEHDDVQKPDADPDWVPVTRPVKSVLGEQVFVITADYAEKDDKRADYSAISVFGIDPRDCWWWWDAWAGRGTPEDLASKVWEFAEKWHATAIGIEAIGPYTALARKVQKTRKDFEKKVGWVPYCRNVRYAAHLSKPVRISGLQWRFDAGFVKIPNNPIGDTRAWQMLNTQIDGFTMDMKNMRFDDVIDTGAMLPHVMGPRFTSDQKPTVKDKQRSREFIEKLIKRRFESEIGVPYITGLTASEVPASALLDHRNKRIEEYVKKTRQPQPTLDLIGKMPAVFTLAELAKKMEPKNGNSDDRFRDRFTCT